MTQQTLAITYGDQHRALPARWDGHAVTWLDWEPPIRFGSLSIHMRPEPCAGCGSREERRTSTGQTTATTWRLLASRCPDCGLDSVYDLTHDEVWTLDDSDYGPAGSTFDGVIETLPPVPPKPSRADLIAQARANVARPQRETLWSGA